MKAFVEDQRVLNSILPCYFLLISYSAGLSCNFETNLCKWKNYDGSDFVPFERKATTLQILDPEGKTGKYVIVNYFADHSQNSL